MEKIDQEIYPKEINKSWDNNKKLSKSHENITMKKYIYDVHSGKMSKPKLNFVYVKAKKNALHTSKHAIDEDKVDSKKIVIYNKILCCKKVLKFPNMSTCAKFFD